MKQALLMSNTEIETTFYLINLFPNMSFFQALKRKILKKFKITLKQYLLDTKLP